MKDKLVAAVIGCGVMGRTIISGIIDIPEVEKVVCFDIEKAQLDEVKKSFPRAELCTNLDELIANEEIDLVYISSSNSTHVPIACAALRAGKAVMTEKPSGITLEEIEELERVAKETGGFLQVGLECRYSWAYTETKKIIVSGEIGKLKSVHFTYSQPPVKETKTLADGTVVPEWRIKSASGGNIFLEKLCHYIDLVRWWNEGSRIEKYIVTSADNVIPYYETEDNVHVSYLFDNGCVSHLYFTATAAPNNTDDLFVQDKLGFKLDYVIVGTEGAVEIDVFQRELRVYHHPGKKGREDEILVRKINWGERLSEEGFKEQLYFHNTFEQNRDIVKRVLSGDKPSISIEDAQETMKVCMEFSEAQKSKKWELIER